LLFQPTTLKNNGSEGEDSESSCDHANCVAVGMLYALRVTKLDVNDMQLTCGTASLLLQAAASIQHVLTVPLLLLLQPLAAALFSTGLIRLLINPTAGSGGHLPCSRSLSAVPTPCPVKPEADEHPGLANCSTCKWSVKHF
jgi:hypothetical protein